MSDLIMHAVSGRVLGSRSSGRLRNEGFVPATLYGHGEQPKSIAVGSRELNSLVIHRKVVGAILEVELDGKVITTLVKEIQRHPVKRNLLHIDLQTLSANEEVSASVQLIAGEGVELLVEGVEVQGPASKIPASIELPAVMLEDRQILVSAIKLPKGVKVITDSDTIIAIEAGSAETE